MNSPKPPPDRPPKVLPRVPVQGKQTQPHIQTPPNSNAKWLILVGICFMLLLFSIAWLTFVARSEFSESPIASSNQPDALTGAASQPPSDPFTDTKQSEDTDFESSEAPKTEQEPLEDHESKDLFGESPPEDKTTDTTPEPDTTPKPDTTPEPASTNSTITLKPVEFLFKFSILLNSELTLPGSLGRTKNLRIAVTDGDNVKNLYPLGNKALAQWKKYAADNVLILPGPEELNSKDCSFFGSEVYGGTTEVTLDHRSGKCFIRRTIDPRDLKHPRLIQLTSDYQKKIRTKINSLKKRFNSLKQLRTFTPTRTLFRDIYEQLNSFENPNDLADTSSSSETILVDVSEAKEKAEPLLRNQLRIIQAEIQNIDSYPPTSFLRYESYTTRRNKWQIYSSQLRQGLAQKYAQQQVQNRMILKELKSLTELCNQLTEIASDFQTQLENFEIADDLILHSERKLTFLESGTEVFSAPLSVKIIVDN